MRKTSMYLAIFSFINPPSFAVRCDQIAVEAMSVHYNEECKGKASTPFCSELERDINNYLTYFYSKDKAACVRIHEKYKIEVLDPIDRNPNRIYRPRIGD